MNTKLSMIAMTALTLGFAPTAHAQDAGTDAGATTASSTTSTGTDEGKRFNGLYIGAAGGYDIQHNDIRSRLGFDRNNDGNFNDTVTTAAGADAFSPGFCNGYAFNATPTRGCRNDRDDASYYGRVGFDQTRGMVVLGVVGEFGKSQIRDYTSGFSTTPANYIFERSLRWEASARLRAGLALGQGIFYGTGGAGYADIRHRFMTTNTANAFAPNNDGKKKFGYVVGGGAETFVTKHISVGVEYTFHDYKDDDFLVRVTQGTAAATNPFVLAPNTAGTTIRRSDENFRWHSLRGTVGFHF